MASRQLGIQALGHRQVSCIVWLHHGPPAEMMRNIRRKMPKPGFDDMQIDIGIDSTCICRVALYLWTGQASWHNNPPPSPGLSSRVIGLDQCALVLHIFLLFIENDSSLPALDSTRVVWKTSFFVPFASLERDYFLFLSQCSNFYCP